MTRLRRSLTPLALCAVLLAGGCADEPEPADAEDVKREARELAETLESYTAEQKAQAVAEARQALAELNDRVEDLRARIGERWGEMDEAARAQAEQNLERLEAEQAELADRFAALRDASGDAWARLREGFTAAYDELRDAWRESEKALAE